jgi:predicted hydrocarbon binding protein
MLFNKFINQLILNKVFTFDKSQILMLDKVPFVMFPARSMAKFIQKVGDEFGEEYLNELGFDAGLIVAKEFTDSFGWVGTGLAKRLGMIFKMFEVMGFGKHTVKIWDISGSRTLYQITNHPVIEHSTRLFGKNEKICSFYRGIESAHWHNELGIKNCHLIETQCISKKRGLKFCEWSNNYFKNQTN